jgi:penicillin-binding protein 2
MRNRDRFKLETMSRRTFMLGGVAMAGFGVLSARLFQLQITNQEEYRLLSEGNQFNTLPIAPRRGRIIDRFGQVVADNRRVWMVAIRKDRAKAERIERLARAIEPGDDQAASRRRLRMQQKWQSRLGRANRFDEVVLEDDLSWDAFSRINLHLPYLPGVSAQQGEVRAYGLPNPVDDDDRLHPDAFAHIVGYVARPSEEDVEERLGPIKDTTERLSASRIVRHPNFRLGRAGLEASLEDKLHGGWGELRVEVDALGRQIREVGIDRQAQRGEDVQLTIDANLQAFAQRRLDGESAACVGLDVHTGEILCMVSAPGFDPNPFTKGIQTEAYRALSVDPRKPLYNKPLDGLYPPGSTFKMITALAALRAGISPSERVFCNSRYRLGDRTFNCWKREGHGSRDMRGAMKSSCDVYFYDIARRVGIQAIADEARRFGLGKLYDIAIPGGKAGIVPDPAWKRAFREEGWAQGETLNTGIGQGFINASPLQLAVMTARLCNGGKAVEPYILAGQSPNPDPQTGLAEPAHLTRIMDTMMGVVEEPGGTAYWSLRAKGIDLDGIRMAGKTGTSQVRYISKEERAAGVIRNEDLPWRRRDHALFVCAAPFDAPRYALALVVEHGGSGSSSAAPPARDILREMVRRDQLRTAALKNVEVLQ